MKGDRIPDEHHVARYVPFTALDEAGRPTGPAFRLKPAKDGRSADEYLSVNWLESLHPAERAEQVRLMREALIAQKIRAGGQAKIAVLVVGQTAAHVRGASADNRNLAFLHEPLPESDSHAGIHGFGIEDDAIADLIAETVTETYPARNVRAEE